MKFEECPQNSSFALFNLIRAGAMQAPLTKKYYVSLITFTGPASCVEHAYAACMVGSITLECLV